jgi:DNA polymerase-3 subunit delta'
MSVPLLELPWHDAPRRMLQQARARQRFPQAILVHAPTGSGGEQFATWVAQLALCTDAVAPCLRCTACRQVALRQYPDLHWPEPENKYGQLSVDQIRSLREALDLTHHYAGGAVAVVAPADGMNESASNALLKMLEEPHAGVCMVLLSAAPATLKATVRSRCLRLQLPVPSRAQALQLLIQQRGAGPWTEVLAVVDGDPLAALAIEDPAAVAALGKDTGARLDEVFSGHCPPADLAARWHKDEHLPWRLRCTEHWVTAAIYREVAQMHEGVAIPQQQPLSGSESMPKIARLLRVAAELHALWRLRDTPVNKAIGLEVLFWQMAALKW